MLHLFAATRRHILAVILIGFAAGSLSAQDCSTIADPDPFGGCFLKLQSYPGDLPYGITVSENEAQVVVADLYSGLFYKLERDNIETVTGPFFSPLGAATYTGLAWHPTEDSFYWLALSAGTPQLVSTSLAGIVLAPPVNLIVPNGGFLSGLTWNPTSGTFWTIDIVNDICYALAADGTLDPDPTNYPPFPIPAQTPFGGPIYGLGLTTVEEPFTGNFLLDVCVGLPSDQRTSMVDRVFLDGTRYGLYYELGDANFATGWITGIAWTPEGSTATLASTFVADLSGNRIIEVPTPGAPQLTARSVLDVTCTSDPANDVTLTWTNPSGYTGIQIFRDGTFISSEPGTATSFVDPDLEGATYEYSVKPTVVNGNLPEAKCSVVVGFGRALSNAAHVGGSPFAITVIESSNRVLVSDLFGGNAYHYNKDLTPVPAPDDVIVGPFAAGTTSGVAWDSSDDTLLWLEGETGELQRTDLAGAPMGTSVFLSPLPLGLMGDIAYVALTDTYYGVDITFRKYFEFNDAGTVLSECDFPDAGTSSGAWGQGVASVADPGAVILDVPVGPANGDKVDRVKRLLDCTDTGIEYATIPTTLSGGIGGIAWTSAGSTGVVSEYIVGFDTDTIYEVSLDLSSVGDDFLRGDVNVDGTRDVSDATTLLIQLFGGGANLTCLDGADVNDSGGVDIADVLFVLDYLFVGGVTLPAPVALCGPDDTDDSLTCDSYDTCP